MTWTTARVGECLAKIKRPGKLQTADYQETGQFPIIDQGEGEIAGYTDNAEMVIQEPLPLVIFGDHTRRVKLAKEPFACGADGTQLLFPDGPYLDPTFFYYAVTSIDLSNYFYARHFKFLKEQKLAYPDLPTQLRIADILSAYDDLIENNRRRMALLEEAARQLYGEWFVRLRFPGYEHTRITNGVPKGWEWRNFADACASLEDGDWIETKDQGGDDYRLLQISNIGINKFVETGNFRYVTEQTFKRLGCRELVPGHILIARMPKPIGRAWLVTEMPWRMITAVDAAIAVADEDLADPYFLTYYLNSPESLEHCARRAVGATRPRVARRELAMLPLVLPPRRLQIHFREYVQPLNQQRATLYKQNEKLRGARDLLLPRLLSGEIAV